MASPLSGTCRFSVHWTRVRRRPGFFTRGSHARENDKAEQRAPFLSFPRVAAARGIPNPLSVFNDNASP